MLAIPVENVSVEPHHYREYSCLYVHLITVGAGLASIRGNLNDVVPDRNQPPAFLSRKNSLFVVNPFKRQCVLPRRDVAKKH